MNNQQIDELLSELQRNDVPRAPDLRDNVRAEIARLRERPTFWQRILPVLGWKELLMQPRLAVSALAVALAIGAIPGAWSLATVRAGTEATYARESLHLDVFEAIAILPNKASRADNPKR